MVYYVPIRVRNYQDTASFQEVLLAYYVPARVRNEISPAFPPLFPLFPLAFPHSFPSITSL
jgi:hypothetical protein